MFKGFFGSWKREASASKPPSPAISAEILKFLGPRGIPVMPASAQRAFELSVKPNAEAREFVEVIASDESLSSRVLKIANSAFFDRGKKSSTIEEAVIVIGLSELQSLLSAATLSELFPSTNHLRKLLWEHDIAVALYARTISECTAPEQSGVAFIGGLMHDIGKLLILQRNPERFAQTLTLAGTKESLSTEAEEELFLFNHCDVGALIAERWHFSDELKSIISRHHRPTAQASLPAIVRCADALVHLNPPYLAGELTALRKYFANHEDEIWSDVEVSHSDRRELEVRCRKVFECEREVYAK